MSGSGMTKKMFIVLVGLYLTLPAKAWEPETGDLSRQQPEDLRVMSWNVENNFINASERDAAFGRVLSSIDPDIVVMQESQTYLSDSELIDRMNSLLPPQSGSWQLHRGLATGADQTIILSRYSLSMQRIDTEPASSTRGVTMALVDLPDTNFTHDLYLMGVHLKCCDNVPSDQEKRQASADAIAAWLGDLQTTGGEIDLQAQTPVIVLGDFNLVGGENGDQPEQTLLTGDIQDEVTYGSDVDPDWDGTDLLDRTPLDPYTDNPNTWSSEYATPISKLDRFFITDSVIDLGATFVLNTKNMTSAQLTAAGLEADDTDIDQASDHLPIVMDLHPDITIEYFSGMQLY